ncbi:hypothetical protein IBD95_05340, partial [Francisella tularensis]|nr:hypothetical protein [Francisella tularensis]
DCVISITYFCFQAEAGIRYPEMSRGLGDVYKRQLFYMISLAINSITLQ